MKNNNYPSHEFYDLIDKMELSDVEGLIVGLSENRGCKGEKIEACLYRRQYLLREQFESNAQNMTRLGEVMQMLKEHMATIFNTTKTLCRQFHKTVTGGWK